MGGDGECGTCYRHEHFFQSGRYFCVRFFIRLENRRVGLTVEKQREREKKNHAIGWFFLIRNGAAVGGLSHLPSDLPSRLHLSSLGEATLDDTQGVCREMVAVRSRLYNKERAFECQVRVWFAQKAERALRLPSVSRLSEIQMKCAAH